MPPALRRRTVFPTNQAIHGCEGRPSPLTRLGSQFSPHSRSRPALGRSPREISALRLSILLTHSLNHADEDNTGIRYSACGLSHSSPTFASLTKYFSALLTADFPMSLQPPPSPMTQKKIRTDEVNDGSPNDLRLVISVFTRECHSREVLYRQCTYSVALFRAK